VAHEAGNGFIHLRVKSAYSLLEGAIKADKVGTMAASAKMPAVGVADRANLFGALEFSQACKDAGVQPLIDKYVKSGRVSYEFRNFVRDPFDLAASLVARCGGTSSFFGLTRGLYSDQRNWMAKIQAADPAVMQQVQALPPQQQFGELAKVAGFQDWAAMRGLPAEKSAACLANQSEVDRLVQMQNDAVSSYDIPGTPSFLLNGELVPIEPGSTPWQQLEAKIKSALGG